MNDWGSGQTAKWDSDHCDVNLSLGARLGGFVISHQPPVAHQPAEGPLHNLNGQLGTKSFDPLGEGLAGVAAVHSQHAQPFEPAQDSFQEQLCSVAFGGVGWSDGHAEHQAQSIHQQMSFAAFDSLAGIVTHAPAVSVGLDALTVQNRSRWPAVLAMRSPNQNTQRIMNHSPLMVGHLLAEDVINGFPLWKISGQIAPRAAAFDQIEDGVEDSPPIFGRSSMFGRFGKHRFDPGPLGVSKVRVVSGDFHRLTGATAKESRSKRQQNQALSLLFRHALTPLWPPPNSASPPDKYLIVPGDVYRRDHPLFRPQRYLFEALLSEESS